MEQGQGIHHVLHAVQRPAPNLPDLLVVGLDEEGAVPQQLRHPLGADVQHHLCPPLGADLQDFVVEGFLDAGGQAAVDGQVIEVRQLL